MTKLIIVLRNFANAPKNRSVMLYTEIVTVYFGIRKFVLWTKCKLLKVKPGDTCSNL